MERRARCRLCNKLITYSDPSSLGHHLLVCHPGSNPVFFSNSGYIPNKTCFFPSHYEYSLDIEDKTASGNWTCPEDYDDAKDNDDDIDDDDGFLSLSDKISRHSNQVKVEITKVQCKKSATATSRKSPSVTRKNSPSTLMKNSPVVSCRNSIDSRRNSIGSRRNSIGSRKNSPSIVSKKPSVGRKKSPVCINSEKKASCGILRRCLSKTKQVLSEVCPESTVKPRNVTPKDSLILLKKRSKEYQEKCLNPKSPVTFKRTKRSRSECKTKHDHKPGCKCSYFRTTVTTWKAAKKCVICPCCGKEVVPLVRKQRNKLTRSPILSSFLLGCWPLCFLFPLQFRRHTRFYCPSCLMPIGEYDKKTGKAKLATMTNIRATDKTKIY